jgi:putative peptidoglycan lipid II flippase
MAFDLLVGGMMSAGIVPVLSGYAETRREDFRSAAGAVLSVLAAVLAAVSVAIAVLAPQIARLLAPGYEGPVLNILVVCLRVLAPSVAGMGLAGAMIGVLHALRRFTWPALSAPMVNVTIIAIAVQWRAEMGIYSLPLGVALGSAAQAAILLVGMRDLEIRLWPSVLHPAVRRILSLYLPVAAGIVVSHLQIGIDARLAFETGPDSLSIMRYATTLVQFPHGLLAVAVSTAMLPVMAGAWARADVPEFLRVLSGGLRLVLTLTLPAAAGMAVLAVPVVQVAFQHGAFDQADTARVVVALHGYLLGLVFAAIDWPLNVAFYARHDTLTPASVGVLSVAVYVVVAVMLLSLGYLGLVLADSAKHLAHSTVMLALARRYLGRESTDGLGHTVWRSSVAATAMVVVMLLLDSALGASVGPALGYSGVVRLAAGLAIGGLVYWICGELLGLAELRSARRQVVGMAQGAWRLPKKSRRA